jgi:hypothetical protein
MAIVIFFAAYAISAISRYILNPFTGQWSLLGNAVIYTAILVISLTYFALPIANRLLRRWLYPGKVQELKYIDMIEVTDPKVIEFLGPGRHRYQCSKCNDIYDSIDAIARKDV